MTTDASRFTFHEELNRTAVQHRVRRSEKLTHAWVKNTYDDSASTVDCPGCGLDASAFPTRRLFVAHKSICGPAGA